MRRGFTLIELLVVIGIVAVVAAAALIVLNPVELLRQARDGDRLYDLQTLERTFKIIEAVGGGIKDLDGPNFVNSCAGQSAQKIFISIPSNNGEATGTAPAGWEFVRVPQNVFRNIDGSGWIPADLREQTTGVQPPLGTLPVDPVNTFASGLYYSYVCGSYEFNAVLESGKYELTADKDAGDDPRVYESGTDRKITPPRKPIVSVVSIAPSSGINTGLVLISTIRGLNFSTSGASVALSRLGESDLSGIGFTATNSSTLSGGSFDINGAATGTWNVVVRNPDGEFGTLVNGFSITAPVVQPPSVSGVSPPSGLVGGGTPVTINGANFVSTPTVLFGGAAASSVTLVSASQLTAITPVHAAGAVDVIVQNPDSQTGVCAGCFAYLTSPATTTTLGGGADPANSTIGPGGAATMLDSFTLETSSGTDAVVSLAISIAGGSEAIQLIEITSNDGTTVYGSVLNPASSSVSVTLAPQIIATAAPTQYKMRITPKSHSAVPAPPGSSYAVGGTVADWSGTNVKVGSDAGSATITVDNLSPGDVTSLAGTRGDGQVSLSWTNPADSDFSNVIILRNTALITDAPSEGSAPLVNDPVGSSIVRHTGSGTSLIDTGLTNGTAYYYKVFSKDTRGNYSSGVQTGPHTPSLPLVVTFDAATTAADSGTSTLSWAHTVSGTDRLLLVGVSYFSGGISSVTYAGNALVKLATAAGGGGDNVDIWYQVGPALGVNNVKVVGTTNLVMISGATSWINVDQVSPFGTHASSTGNSAAPSVSVFSAPREAVQDVLAYFPGSSTIAVGANQILRWSGIPGPEGGAGSTEPGSAGVTMSWSISTSTSWSLLAVPIKPAP